jgi:hypothetical protein
MPKEGEQLEGMGSDDYSLDDYLTTSKDILEHALENNNYLEFTMMELGKLLKDMRGYMGVMRKKGEKLVGEVKDLRNRLDNSETQESFTKAK